MASEQHAKDMALLAEKRRQEAEATARARNREEERMRKVNFHLIEHNLRSLLRVSKYQIGLFEFSRAFLSWGIMRRRRQRARNREDERMRMVTRSPMNGGHVRFMCDSCVMKEHDSVMIHEVTV